MRVAIIQTINCKHCKADFEFEILPLLKGASDGNSGVLPCPHCHFASGMNLNTGGSELASSSVWYRTISSIQNELNTLCALRFKENGFISSEFS